MAACPILVSEIEAGFGPVNGQLFEEEEEEEGAL